MSDLLAAADVLVHSTAGLTVLEAQIRGTRVISYGWGRGHIRANNRAYERLGLAAVARTPAQLAAAIREALASPATPDDALRALPRAADVVRSFAEAAAALP
jgi:UDP-N-acetylglucosamine:LPS N-acetylglucosamine transferase